MKDRQAQVFRFVVALGVVLGWLPLPGWADEPFKLGVEEKAYLESAPMSGYANYPSSPAPKMVPQQPRPAANPPPRPPMQTGVAATAPRPPIQATIQKVTLPPAFLGVWNVSGQRVKVEA